MKTGKLLNQAELARIRKEFAHKKIVHCHGVFDVLHAGHMAYFNSAKTHGDLLVVTITADKHVNKGPGRPYFTAHIRAEMIAALEITDFVAINENPTAVPIIELLQPDVYVKGPDYKNLEADVTGGILAEKQAIESVGGQLVFTEDTTFSSSTLINRFLSPWTESQTEIIEAVKAIGGYSKIEEVLERVSKLKINVIGEPIVDTYVFCRPESISSKSPTVSARSLYTEDYAGGSLAIANHLVDFVSDLKLIFTRGTEEYFTQLLEKRVDPRIDLISETLEEIPTPRKTRFIEIGQSQRIFEITHLRSDQWSSHSSAVFCKSLMKVDSSDATHVIADFGHGLFEENVLKTLSSFKGFIGLNVQTNSSNYGFNPFTKHKKYSFLSIDSKEARIAYHDRHSSPLDLAKKIKSDLGPKGVSFAVTLGSDGAYYFPKKMDRFHLAPAFADKVIDATGAGDAFFGLTSLLERVECPPVLVPFLGNIFAGLKTKIIGNKSQVPKAQFLKAVSSILK